MGFSSVSIRLQELVHDFAHAGRWPTRSEGVCSGIGGLGLVRYIGRGRRRRSRHYGPSPKCPKGEEGPPRPGNASYGTLGYGPPGIFPGFQGFGLGYHLGYGYGGEPWARCRGGYPSTEAPAIRTPSQPSGESGASRRSPLVLAPAIPPLTIPNTSDVRPAGPRPTGRHGRHGYRRTDRSHRLGPFTGAVPNPKPCSPRSRPGPRPCMHRTEAGPSCPTAIPTTPIPTIPPPGHSMPSTPPATGGPSSCPLSAALSGSKRSRSSTPTACAA